MNNEFNSLSYENDHHIDSVKYAKKIDFIFKEFGLLDKTGISNFCICFCFRNNDKYYLSNMPDWSIKYHQLGGDRSDEVFDLRIMKNKDFYFPRKSDYDVVQSTLVHYQENNFNYFDTYSLIRRCVDSTIILLALHRKPIDTPLEVYEKTKQTFENFCFYFISNMLDEIKISNPIHKSYRLLNDKTFLEAIIKKQAVKNLIKLTEREKECILLLKNGHPTKTSAKYMGISEKTFRNYLEKIRSKLCCNSIPHLLEVITGDDI